MNLLGSQLREVIAKEQVVDCLVVQMRLVLLLLEANALMAVCFRPSIESGCVWVWFLWV